ncbi:shugoshin-1-like [Jatropha curcas]|uniref:shugoshin-1-like n=1 Tax=Jatropha curcas TaxID=180498 RepID=UPI001895B269|nr:shugoshin-1-like [Jatropha curcas]
MAFLSQLKALQHELVCKDALLKAKNMRLQKNQEFKTINRIRRRTARSQSIGPSTTSRQGIEKEKLENKRRCLRRQSARFKSQEREPKENLFEIEDLKFSISQSVDNPIQEDGLKEETLCELRNEAPRSSFGRPVRRAAEKVQSYKELPLNVKMRREE